MKNRVSVFDCSIIDLGQKGFDKGNITIIDKHSDFPFVPKRIFYLYDIIGGESRGAHAHKECSQLLIAASGSFEVIVDDGVFKRQILLNRPNMGLYLPPPHLGK